MAKKLTYEEKLDRAKNRQNKAEHRVTLAREVLTRAVERADVASAACAQLEEGERRRKQEEEDRAGHNGPIVSLSTGDYVLGRGGSIFFRDYEPATWRFWLRRVGEQEGTVNYVDIGIGDDGSLLTWFKHLSCWQDRGKFFEVVLTGELAGNALIAASSLKRELEKRKEKS